MSEFTKYAAPGLNTVWLSDIHLGCRNCRAEFLLDFLERIRCDRLYLVGDVIDFRAMRNRMLWPASHHAVFRKIIAMASAGVRVTYIPGNHDEHARDLAGQRLLNIDVRAEAVHTTAAGRKLLVVHGDQFEHAVRYNALNRLAGDVGYDLLLFGHRWSNRVRRYLKLPYWSLAGYVKNRVRNARAAIDAFETAAANEARHRGMDGIVCGHIHQPEMRTIDGTLYCNDGDWVESCTALVELRNGALELAHWSDLQQALKFESAADDPGPRQALAAAHRGP